MLSVGTYAGNYTYAVSSNTMHFGLRPNAVGSIVPGSVDYVYTEPNTSNTQTIIMGPYLIDPPGGARAASCLLEGGAVYWGGCSAHEKSNSEQLM